MVLDDHPDLVAAIGNWLGRADLTARIPDFIKLAEVEFNRRLRTMEMEIRVSYPIAASIALPADFLGLRSVSVANTQVSYLPANDFDRLNLIGPDVPKFYTIADGFIWFTPVPASGTTTLNYYQRIPALTSVNTTNWLMTAHPDLYLFSALAQAEFYGWNDDRLPLIKARIEEVFAQIEGLEDQRTIGAPPLAPRLQAGAWLNI